MSTIEHEIDFENTNTPQEFHDLTWIRPDAYRCHVRTVREDDGTFSAMVLNLPGCGSCGDTEEDAVANVREAVLGVIESHLAAGEEIPWRNTVPTDIPKGATQKWILVNG